MQRLLAEVRWRQGDRAEARALAQVAADTYGPLGEASAADHADAQRWLQTHRLSQRDAADTRP